jgi:hypothetical protein
VFKYNKHHNNSAVAVEQVCFMQTTLPYYGRIWLKAIMTSSRSQSR